jgi:hypothetical protein
VIREQGDAEISGKEHLESVKGEKMILTLMKEFEGRFEIEPPVIIGGKEYSE